MPGPTDPFGDPIVAQRFIFDSAPFPSCHAATLAETAAGRLLAAFFGGTREGAPDVRIFTSRYDGSAWSPPQSVADGVESDGGSLPCWNPVLFRPTGGDLTLFYKVGPSPSKWWGMT
jgi:predicted neuraminidase